MTKLVVFLTLLISVSVFSEDKLTIGSYGRIGIASNLDGGAGTATQIVSHSTRIEKAPYQELYLKYDFTDPESAKNGIKTKLNFTMAFDENMFHYTGKFEMNTAVRDFYIDVDNVFMKELSLWVGSRMYRGDDIYLLDFWPLQSLNTIGAGLKYSFNSTDIKFHVGANRLDQGDVEEPYQLLYYTIPLRDQIGSEDVIILDRQKYITSLELTHLLKPLKLKLKLYGEFHTISEADYSYESKEYKLPSDKGYLLGFQATHFGFLNNQNNYTHIFVKYSAGMAAYGELGVPFDLNNSKTTSGAKEFLTGLSLNLEKGDFGLLAGAYFRTFRDADTSDLDSDDTNEATVSLRFLYYIGNYFHLSTELNYQNLQIKNIDSTTMNQESANMFKFIFMPTISPNGRGNLKQPKIRLVYSLSMYNGSAEKVLQYKKFDNYKNPNLSKTPSSDWGNQAHYLGLSAEWWFNN